MMCTDQQSRNARTQRSILPAQPAPQVGAPVNPQALSPQPAGLRVELVDNWHAQWRTVLSAIDAMGQREALCVDVDGWLSARQVLLVAFSDTSVAGHVCFSISPMAGEKGEVIVEAQIDAFGIQPGFAQVDVRSTLVTAAEERAKALRCDKLIGL